MNRNLPRVLPPGHPLHPASQAAAPGSLRAPPGVVPVTRAPLVYAPGPMRAAPPSVQQQRRAQQMQAIHGGPHLGPQAIVTDDFGQKDLDRQRMGLMSRDAPPTPDSPTYRPLAGVIANNRGSNQTIPFAQQTPITVVETPKDTGQDAEQITVVCGASFNVNQFAGQMNGGSPLLPQAPAVQGQLTWGIGGASFQLIFDWMNGLAFSLPASYVRVAGYQLPQLDLGLNVTVCDAVVSAGLAYGSRGYNPGSLRLTVPFSIGASPGSASVVIPPFATQFYIVGESITGEALDVKITGNIVNTAYAGGSRITFQVEPASDANTTQQGPFILPNAPIGQDNGGTDGVLIVSNQLTHTLNGAIIFVLGI